MSDIDDLTALLQRWQVPYEHDCEKQSKYPDGQGICVGGHDTYGLTPENDRVTGYNGFYTMFEFDAAGTFLKMGAWE